MFQVLEKAGERKAVHSKDDLDYMLRRGWSKVVPPANDAPPVVTVEAVRVKRKYTRRATR